MITTEYTIDNLTTTSVSVKKQQYYNELPLGQPHRKAYMNTVNGRQELQSEVPQQYVDAILLVWGNTPIEQTPEE